MATWSSGWRWTKRGTEAAPRFVNMPCGRRRYFVQWTKRVTEAERRFVNQHFLLDPWCQGHREALLHVGGLGKHFFRSLVPQWNNVWIGITV